MSVALPSHRSSVEQNRLGPVALLLLRSRLVQDVDDEVDDRNVLSGALEI